MAYAIESASARKQARRRERGLRGSRPEPASVKVGRNQRGMRRVRDGVREKAASKQRLSKEGAKDVAASLSAAVNESEPLRSANWPRLRQRRGRRAGAAGVHGGAASSALLPFPELRPREA